jgi:hypothetical protein
LRELALTVPGLAGGLIPDGPYRVTIKATGIAGTSGNPMSANYNLDFFVLAADANRDTKVNALDFNALATNFGASGRTFTTGDFNYDGHVNSLDFNVLAARFNQPLPAGAVPQGMTLAARPVQFSPTRIVASLWGDQDDSDASIRDFADIEN